MAYKDWDAEASPASEQHTFRIAGQTFTLVPEMPWDLLNKWAKIQMEDIPGVQVFVVMDELFQTLIVDEDLERWNLLLNDKRQCPSHEVVSQIALWMVEQYTARPTQPPLVSANGRVNGEPSSTVNSSVPATAVVSLT